MAESATPLQPAAVEFCQEFELIAVETRKPSLKVTLTQRTTNNKIYVTL